MIVLTWHSRDIQRLILSNFPFASQVRTSDVRRKSTISAIKRGVVRTAERSVREQSRIKPSRGGSIAERLHRSRNDRTSSRRLSGTIDRNGFTAREDGHHDRKKFSEQHDTNSRRRDAPRWEYLKATLEEQSKSTFSNSFKQRKGVAARQGGSLVGKTSSRRELKPRSGKSDSFSDTVEVENDDNVEEGLSYHPTPARNTFAPSRISRASNADPTRTTAHDYTRKMPISIPYSAADSEFLYGNSVVIAALKARKRRLRKIYLHSRAISGTHESAMLERLAKQLIPSGQVMYVGDAWLPVMDKMADNRPHNGVVLEASPLPKWRVSALEAKTPIERGFADHIGLMYSMLKDSGQENSLPAQLPSLSRGQRHPFVLFIDDVLDPGNLGAIIRSAYFLGVDALLLANGTCAPLSNVALKASAGAAEAIPILTVDNPVEFLQKSKGNGWRVYAGVTPERRHATNAPESRRHHHPYDGRAADLTSSRILYTKATAPSQLFTYHVPLSEAPSILMLGGEGSGMRRTLKSEAEYHVSMTAAKRESEIGVDSLNISVAAAILMADFLRGSQQSHNLVATQEDKKENFYGEGDLGF